MNAAVAKLIPAGTPLIPHEIVLADFPVRLGRRAGAGVFVPDRWVSRDHCEIVWVDDVLTVRDLGSKHGTYVNGHAVTECELHPGDELSVGLSRFVIQYEPQSAIAELAREPQAAVV